jgi:ribose transport system permease protein
MDDSSTAYWKRLNQEGIVLAIAVVLFVAASVGLPGFFAADNLVSIVRSVSVLGILALGMAIVIIGRGIDLSAVAIMAMSVAWYLQLLNNGTGDGVAFAYVVAGVLAIGILNGFLVAYADVPAIFVTLASGSFVFGYVRSQLITQDAVPVPPGHWVELLGGLRYLDVPVEVFIFAALAFLMFLFLRYTKWGRYVYYAGDNPVGARNIGIPVRPMLVLRYVISALVAFIAGLLTAASLHSINTRVVNSTLLYDIVLIAVIGGIGLSGGKGGVRNVLFGAALIGILLNAMTIIDIPLLYQNLIKAAILLGAIVVDGIINPRDEQTAQQGDI